MYILYGTGISTPIIYKDLDTIMLKIINSRDNGNGNEYYQKIKKIYSYSPSDYNISYHDDIYSTTKDAILFDKSESNETLLEYIYSVPVYNNPVFIVNDKALFECLLYCRTIHKIVAEQMGTFYLDDNILLCDIDHLLD
jgi:hypothetical protein